MVWNESIFFQDTKGSGELGYELVCMTAQHQYNNINNQLDATITVY